MKTESAKRQSTLDFIEDSNDEGLSAIFGPRFQDLSNAKPQKPASKPKEDAPQEEAEQKAADASWEAMEPGWLLSLRACAKWVAIFGGLCALVYYWQETGQMLPSAAVPSMCLCTMLAGFGIGRNISR